ncbi:G-protein coupled receptor 4-like [Epinephelus fuscoguttatus]|uniref:G-protein coupled receptor 4-like n=1 Tax=Epinephelus fuscoguttatus TaxID=293821 RepID=UPI0020D10379|nr:G-protein coupled receptor 4-like [Epinephelus fuscoguttatus]
MEDYSNIHTYSPDIDFYYVFAPFVTYFYRGETGFIIKVVTCIIICIGLPLTLMAIYALFSQVRNDHVAPIYISNLLISDLIQLCCLIAEVAQPKDRKIVNIFTYIYYFCVGASGGFMVCIALERYLVIACPLWYRFRRTIKISVVVCVVVWVLPLAFLLPLFICKDGKVQEIIVTIFCFLPLPLLIFFLGGTLKALSASISVPSDEKRRIVGMLVLVLLIYMLFFLPSIILLLVYEARSNDTLRSLFPVFLRLNPVADLFLYVFMRKGTIDKLLASVCCCRMDSSDISSPTVEMNPCPQSAIRGEGERERETIEGDV